MRRLIGKRVGHGLLITFLSIFTVPLRVQSSRTNVILISLDQLRADRLHCLGNSRLTSPNLDRLAEQGVKFSNFYSVAPWTAPSYATLMTSLYPSWPRVTLFWRPGDLLIDPKTPVLAELFKSQGYHTAAFVNNGVAVVSKSA